MDRADTSSEMGTPWCLGPDSKGRVVRIIGDRIDAVGGPDLMCHAREKPLDCHRARIEPGHVNAHTHLYSGLAPLGLPPPQPKPKTFVEILERLWWRLDRALDADSLRAAARYYVSRALRSGTTTLVDHHESPELIEGSLDIIAGACISLGMRAVLCYGATERNGGLAEGREGLEECRVAAKTGYPETIRCMVGLHASFTVSDQLISEAGALCRELGVPLHVHLAEAGSDVRDARERGYEGPLERLVALDAVPEGSLLVHGVHLSRAQVERAAERGCWLAWNPRSNQNNDVGFASSLDATDKVALGTDGFPAEMYEELAAGTALLEEHDQPAELGPRRLDNGRALVSERFGLPVGTLESGAAADLVVRDKNGVRHVIVGGRVVVGDGALTGGEIESIREEARYQVKGLRERMRWL